VNEEGIFNFNATSRGPATVLGNFMIQQYSGSFSVTSHGVNLLSATFSEPVLGSGNQLQLQNVSFTKGSFHFTSDINGLAFELNHPLDPLYFVAFFDVNPLVGITDGTFAPFTANVGSAFTTTGVATPELSTYAMMLLGFIGLGYAGCFRKSRAS
jgi:hypothetical protein